MQSRSKTMKIPCSTLTLAGCIQYPNRKATSTTGP